MSQSKTSMNDVQIALLAALVAERHRIPESDIVHPKVIVPGDPFMTMKLREPNYVPYCLVKAACGRVRRVPDGFQCSNCGNKVNYDLTHFNGNKNVQYEEASNV